MTEKTAIKRRARKPTLQFDLGEIEKLAGLQLNQRAIAGWFNCHRSSLVKALASDPELRKAYERGRAKMQAGLIQKMVQRAIGDPDDPKSGNDVLLIHLSKHLCGMHDHVTFQADAVRLDEDLGTETAMVETAAQEIGKWTPEQIREYAEGGIEPSVGELGDGPGVIDVEVVDQDAPTIESSGSDA